MEDVSTRSYRQADAPALAELMNAIERHGGGRPSNTAEDLHELISMLVPNPETDSTMLFAADGTLVAAGFTTTPPAGGFRTFLTGGVHPQWRGRGIGRELLGRHLARAREIHQAVAPDAAWEAQIVRTPTASTDSIRLYERFGLLPVRYWFEMTVPAAGARMLPPLAGIRIEGYQPEHERAVYDVHVEAFADNWGFQQREFAGWLTLTVRSATFLPRLSFTAFDGDRLVGYILTYVHAEADRVYAGHMGVLRPWRKRGVGSALLTSVMQAADAAGLKEVELSVDADSPSGAVSIYERVGFTTRFSSVTHSLTLAGGRG